MTDQEIMDSALFEIRMAARGAANRHRSVGKDDRYAEKRKDAEAYLNDSTIPESDIPYLVGYASVHDLTLQQGAEIIALRVSEARAAGAKIETAEDAGKLAVKNAQTDDAVCAAKNECIEILNEL